ncbi:hypothetical protein NDU88_006025 [Pleurodeles waltl]|uniref:Uncharacterized protein n=1 Tax=Pleurodeles waltl TaxID=8319 RepID=A0AAV7SNB7_PLEWA|nr:hypothetical protein NDU88_006025 [Pleurodeles waltl]
MPTTLSQDMTAIMVALNVVFCTMEERFDMIAGCIDKLAECLDRQGIGLDTAEKRISEGCSATMQKQMEKMEHTLKEAAMKCEELGAHSHRNNICIAGAVETTNMGKPDTFGCCLLSCHHDSGDRRGCHYGIVVIFVFVFRYVLDVE